MDSNEIWEASEAPRPGAERAQLNRRIDSAQDVAPPAEQGAFRYSDASLGGEVRTKTEGADALRQLTVAELHTRDGATKTVGTVTSRMEPDVVTVDGDSMIAPNYGVEDALLSEVSQNARAHGIHEMRVWMPGGDATSASKWQSHGFHLEKPMPGAHGQHFSKRI